MVVDRADDQRNDCAKKYPELNPVYAFALRHARTLLYLNSLDASQLPIPKPNPSNTAVRNHNRAECHVVMGRFI